MPLIWEKLSLYLRVGVDPNLMVVEETPNPDQHMGKGLTHLGSFHPSTAILCFVISGEWLGLSSRACLLCRIGEEIALMGKGDLVISAQLIEGS